LFGNHGIKQVLATELKLMQLPEIFYPIFGYILGSLPIALWVTFLL